MSAKLTKYTIELVCTAPQWWNFNVYLMAAGYDAQNRRIAFNSLEDRVRDIGSHDNPNPSGERAVSMDTDPCVYAEIYMYAVANALPESGKIGDTPPFPLILRVSSEGKIVEEAHYDVNQLGGLAIVAHRVGAEGEKE